MVEPVAKVVYNIQNCQKDSLEGRLTNDLVDQRVLGKDECI